MILGKHTIMPIELAQSIASFSRSVARLECANKAFGTAFLISKDLALTAAHCVGAQGQSTEAEITLNFDFVEKAFVESSQGSSFIDAVPYPWENAAASELHGKLASAYPDNASRLQILQLAGIKRQYLLSEGTPHRTWTQALDFAASAGKARDVVKAVLADERVAGFHDEIRDLLKSESTVTAKPIKIDLPEIEFMSDRFDKGWAVLRLDKPVSRAPLLLGSADNLKSDDGVVIIQHPVGGYKQFVLEPSGVLRVEPEIVHYKADTQAGSSGAPVFDRNMQVIALHFFGSDQGNGGVRIDKIKSILRASNLDFVDGLNAADQTAVVFE